MASFDVSQLREEVAAGYKGRVKVGHDWRADSWQRPQVFWRELFDFASARSVNGFRSRLDEYYDLYRDFVGRHVASRRAAFVEYDALKGWHGATYQSVDTRAGLLRDAWAAVGVTEGASVALVVRLDGDGIGALLAALRMGLVVTHLPPLGATFVANRLRALEPDYVVCADQHLDWLRCHARARLPLVAPAGTVASHRATSHTYPADAVVFRAFSPFGSEPLAPVEVTAHEVFTRILRDSELVFCMDGSDTLGAPGFDAWQWQVPLLLTCLCAGASYCRVEVSDLVAEPSILSQPKPTLLGIHPDLRDLMLRGNGPRCANLRAWFRDPSLPLDWERWDRFGRLLAIEGVPGFNVLGGASYGGCFLSSPWDEQPNYIAVEPAPGEPFELLDVNGSGQPSLGAGGIYAPTGLSDGRSAVGQFLIGRSGDRWAFSGAVTGGRGGHVYPMREVEDVCRTHREVDAAVALVNPAAGRLNDVVHVVLVFLDPRAEREDMSRQMRELVQLLELEMGRRFVPDRIELFHLHPRQGDDGVDKDWCRSQYLRGTLRAKAGSRLFGDLAALQREVAEAAARA